MTSASTAASRSPARCCGRVSSTSCGSSWPRRSPAAVGACSTTTHRCTASNWARSNARLPVRCPSRTAALSGRAPLRAGRRPEPYGGPRDGEARRPPTCRPRPMSAGRRGWSGWPRCRGGSRSWRRVGGWSLGEPFEPGGNCSWVAPGTGLGGRERRAQGGVAAHRGTARGGGPGRARRSRGGRGVRLRAPAGPARRRAENGDTDTTAMLLERCRPGAELRGRPEAEQHVVLTDLLRSVWAVDLPSDHPFRPLSVMADDWVVRAERGWPPARTARRRARSRGAGAVSRAVAPRRDRGAVVHRPARGQRAVRHAPPVAAHRSEAVCRRPALRRRAAPAQLQRVVASRPDRAADRGRPPRRAGRGAGAAVAVRAVCPGEPGRRSTMAGTRRRARRLGGP